MSEQHDNNVEQEVDENHLIQIRKEKLFELQKNGQDPFAITKYDRTHTSKQIKDNYKELEEKDVGMQYLINLGIAGLKRVLLNRQFTTSVKIENELTEYEETNNPIIGFFKECEVEQINIENEPTNEVYKKYKEFCIRNSLQELSSGEFSKQVKKYFNFVIIDKKIQGKKCRIFVKAEGQ